VRACRNYLALLCPRLFDCVEPRVDEGLAGRFYQRRNASWAGYHHNLNSCPLLKTNSSLKKPPFAYPREPRMTRISRVPTPCWCRLMARSKLAVPSPFLFQSVYLRQPFIRIRARLGNLFGTSGAKRRRRKC
jgi:hypothetical protein